MALYREATQRSEDGLTVDIQDEIPVDQAVPIGTKLQLRATINDNSGNRWYLMWFFNKKINYHANSNFATSFARKNF